MSRIEAKEHVARRNPRAEVIPALSEEDARRRSYVELSSSKPDIRCGPQRKTEMRTGCG
jgi:hypothetical protein